MGETTLQSRFCALETRYEISQKKKNVVSRVKNLPWRPVSRVDFVLWRPDMRLGKKKKNVVSRVKNLPWRPLSRVDFVLWSPDMRLAQKKKMWSPESKIFPGDHSPE